MNRQLRRLTPSKALTREQLESSFQWHPTLFKIMSFGHVPAAVDWLFIQFMADTNIEKVTDDRETAIFRLLDLATELDPAYFPLYTIGGNYLAIIRGDRHGALRIVEKGEKFRQKDLPTYPQWFRDEYWEYPWRVPMILGYIQLLEFQNVPAAQRAYLEITKLPKVPIYVRGLAAGMQTARGRIRVARNSVEIVEKWYENDPVMKAPVTRARRLLDLAGFLYDANKVFEKEKKKDLGAFLRVNGLPSRDAFGGEFFLTPEGRIDTPTSKEPVFGTTVDLLVRTGDNQGP